jgi:RHS repeat-associated protein
VRRPQCRVTALDADGNGVTDLLFPDPATEFFQRIEIDVPSNTVLQHPLGERVGAFRTDPMALGKTSPRFWHETPDHNVALSRVLETRYLFPDLNGDGIADVVFFVAPNAVQYAGPVTQYLTGDGAAVDLGVLPNVETRGGAHTFDLYPYARVLDYNGDGRDDLLLPEAETCDPGPYCVRYVVWQSAKLGQSSMRVRLDIVPPNASDLANYYAWPLSTYKKRLQMRITDLDADGTPDLVFPGGGGGPLKTYTNRGKLDYVTEIATGQNPLSPPAVLFCPNAPTGRCAGGDPHFHPDIAITYGPLTSPAFDPDASLYAAHVDAKNPCVYPRGCTVSQEPVVSGVAVTSGDNQRRSFSLRYRDGRFDRSGHGFLGFGTVIRRDDDTGRTSIEQFDNVTYDDAIRAYPYAGRVARRASYVRAANADADPSRVDMTFAVDEPTRIQTWGSAIYYVTSAAHTETVAVGHWSAGAGQGRLEDYVLDPNHAAVTVRKAHRTAKDFDAFGHARHIEQWTEGLSEKTVTDDTTSDDANLWLMGKLEARTVCSTALGKTQCQTIEYDYDPTTGLMIEMRRAPELDSASLKVHLDRDAQGNVWHQTEEDKQGHFREMWIDYDPEGVFPASITNALKQVASVQFDPASGQKLVETDVNEQVRKWRYDELGLLTESHAIDGTVTVVHTKRRKSSLVGADFWQTEITTETPGYGAQREELDSVGRVVQRARRGPNVPMRGADGALLAPQSWIVQDQRYNRLGQLVYRSMSHLEDDPSAVFGTTYWYDRAGRLVDVKAPNGATAHNSFGAFPGGTTVLETTTQAPDAVLPPKTKKVLDAEGRVTEVHDAVGGVVRYGYGPFGRLATVTGVDLTSTGIDHDPYGRVVHLHDPDKGDSSSEYDGFDELVQTTDALARTTSYKMDELGRVYERANADGFTRYTYDKRPHGKGLLGRVEEVIQGISRDFYFDSFSRLTSMELSQGGGTIVAKAERGFDSFGRVSELRYPTQPGLEGFSVFYEYDDTSGELVAVTDRDDQDYWRLLAVDGQGHAVQEQYGAQTSRGRSFDPATGALLSIRTTSGSKTLQDWAYAHDKRGNPIARYDLRQEDASKTSEFFHFDALDRLTCSSFAACRPGDISCYGSAPPSPGSCDQSVTYDPNGNITSKSDIGGYTYDPAHPHAVQSITGAGAATYGYDAVGNQTERPGVIGTISYNSFDLPTAYTTALGATSLTYDDAGQRIRKVDPEQETLYFGAIYERITTANGVEDRYVLSNAEGVFAVASRSALEQKTPEVRYVFTDHLGSTDVITDETGSIEHERQSYDAFGTRRNVAWGKPMPPPSGPPETTARGYTGHALDAEVGLVNAKGRLYDPKLGRFGQVDPLQTDLFNSQRWNSYTYGLNNPLRYTDPTGWDEEDEGAPLEPMLDANGQIDPTQGWAWHCTGDGNSCTGEIKPITPAGGDLATAQAGSPAEEASAPAAPSALDAIDASPAVHGTGQAWGGFFVGLGLGLTPGGAVADQFLSTARAMDRGTHPAQVGKAIGEMLGGFFLTASGLTGEIIGTGLTTTGIGSVLGVPAMAVSLGLVTSGAGNMAFGLRGFSDALMSSGSGSMGPQAAAPTVGGAGSAFRVVNSKMPHAAQRAVERAGFVTRKDATEALRAFGQGIEKNGLPSGTVRDAAGHVVVPRFGEGGAVVYRLSDGKLTLQTVLNWTEGMGTPFVP